MRRDLITVRVTIMVAVLAIVATGCGGGGASSTTQPPPDPATTVVVDETTTTNAGPSSTVTTQPSTTSTSFPPIYGYGDFSAYGYGKVPWDEVTALEIQCLRDHGVSVEESGPIGISYTGTEQQGMLWMAYFEACMAGLNLPDESTLTPEDFGDVFDFWLDQADCFRELGFLIPDPPSRDSFIETYPVVDWVPHRFVPEGQLQSALETCPGSPWG